ncbi:MAG: zinc-binding dehydrogenase [Alphaproteobacteria bacterium]|nr:zinc-binding dehydrogenase [Alphaproteobacteria bacterium]MBV9373492.1 zinc-binding dehydrogenase [Alphaproteobacteria bacterium]
MLAVVNTPAGSVPVQLREVPEPGPAPNEALVEVRAFSLNRGELRLFQIRPNGWRPGQDISGVVLQPAADGSGPRAGARVVALTDNAGWAERAAVPTRRMAVLPDNVLLEEAAALPVAGLTALRTLRHGTPLLGKRVLITGASGGVGHLATQIAARSGARVTAVVGRPERGRHLRGADEIIEDIDKAQGLFPLILESAGGSSLAAAISHIEAKGTIVVFGNSSGEPTPFSFRDLAEHPNARIQGFSYFTSEPEERFAPDLELLASLVAEESLKPHLVEHSWRELAQIGPQLRDRQIRGKAVFHID